MRFPKRCVCGLSWLIDAWLKLPWIGVMGDDTERFELRHCTCRSTLSMPMTVVEQATSELAQGDRSAEVPQLSEELAK
jgi:hypothetical protein